LNPVQDLTTGRKLSNLNSNLNQDLTTGRKLSNLPNKLDQMQAHSMWITHHGR